MFEGPFETVAFGNLSEVMPLANLSEVVIIVELGNLSEGVCVKSKSKDVKKCIIFSSIPVKINLLAEIY